MENNAAAIPMRHIGPILINNSKVKEEVYVPMMTYETTLWPSTKRGAKISSLCGGISTRILGDNMTRSIALSAPNIKYAYDVSKDLYNRLEDIANIVESTSRFAKFDKINTRIVGNIFYIRLSIHPGDASGHNMVTKAADALMQWILQEYSELEYISVSANWCIDKKVSAVNGILGRGIHVIAELIIPQDICKKYLRTSPREIYDLHVKKNLVGSIISGSTLSANAHFANILLATYLATGQDAANIVEGSQGLAHIDIQKDGSLYFSVNLPNIIVGTVGNGKQHGFVVDNLKNLGCQNPDASLGENRRRLAKIIAATVLCGELSLISALTNFGELVQSHEIFERKLGK